MAVWGDMACMSAITELTVDSAPQKPTDTAAIIIPTPECVSSTLGVGNGSYAARHAT